MSSTMSIVLTKTKYHRIREYNRRSEEFQNNILNHLEKIGPTPITEFVEILQTSFGLITGVLDVLIVNGFVEKKTPEQARISKHRMKPNVKSVLVITAAGKNYLKKQSELQNYIQRIKR